ncbi:MAG: glycine cleavage system protein GcvH [Bacteroidales bacterium]|nr:glycine cleavage system protein GcvH [Bacteroidales bacterium]
MKILENLKYAKNHEWIKVEGDTGIIGITDFAQNELGDIVFVEVDTVDEDLEMGETVGIIEAVKTVSDIFMPVSGEVIEFNEALEDNPDLINKDAYGEGWIVKIKISDPAELDELMDAEGYKNYIGA